MNKYFSTYEELCIGFPARLNALIDSHGITQLRVAQDTGIAAPTISRYVTGERNPDLLRIFILAQYFNVSIEYILGISNDQQGNNLPEHINTLVQNYLSAAPRDREIVDFLLAQSAKSASEE